MSKKKSFINSFILGIFVDPPTKIISLISLIVLPESFITLSNGSNNLLNKS